jgi:hypothetical protein
VGNGFKPQDVVAVKGVGDRFVDFLHTLRQAWVFLQDGQLFPCLPAFSDEGRVGRISVAKRQDRC